MKITSIINNLKETISSYKANNQKKNTRAILNEEYIPMEGISGFTKDTQIKSLSSEKTEILKYDLKSIKLLSLPELLILNDSNFLGNEENIKEIKEYISAKIYNTKNQISTQNVKSPNHLDNNLNEQASKSEKNVSSKSKKTSTAIVNNSKKDNNPAYDYYRDKIVKDKNTHSSLVSFASSPESIATYFNKKNLTIFINGIHHEDERSSSAMKCKQFLNDNFKKQRIYFEILENLSEGIVLANVYIDKEKKINLASLADRYGFSHSKLTPFDENNLILPDEKVTPKYNSPKDINISEYSDSKIIEENKEPENSQNSHNEKAFLIPYFEKYKNNDKSEDIGLVLKFGKAPYLFDDSKSLSFFLTLYINNKEKTLWGIKLEEEIKKSLVYPGDFVTVNKISMKNEKTGRTFHDWNINILEKSLDKNLQEQYLSSNPSNKNDTNNIPEDNQTSSINSSSSVFDIHKESTSDKDNTSLSFLFDDEDNPFSSPKSPKP